MAFDAPYGGTQVLILDGLHPETARPEGRNHIPKFQLIQDRGLSTCTKPDLPLPVHTACSVRALLVDAHQLSETLRAPDPHILREKSPRA